LEVVKFDMKEISKIRALISSTMEHDRHSCCCEGCRWWWMANVTTHHGQLMEMFPNVKTMIKERGIDTWTKDLIIRLRIVTLCNERPLWVPYESNKRMVMRDI